MADNPGSISGRAEGQSRCIDLGVYNSCLHTSGSTPALGVPARVTEKPEVETDYFFSKPPSIIRHGLTFCISSSIRAYSSCPARPPPSIPAADR